MKRDEGYEALKKLSSKVIAAFVEEGIIQKDELSHINFNPSTQSYEQEFHMTIINLGKGATFNAVSALEKFKFKALGTMSLSHIHISSREAIDLYDGTRIARKDYFKKES